MRASAYPKSIGLTSCVTKLPSWLGKTAFGAGGEVLHTYLLRVCMTSGTQDKRDQMDQDAGAGEDEAGRAWTNGIAREWADELEDPRQEIYTIEDGTDLSKTSSSINPAAEVAVGRVLTDAQEIGRAHV